MNKEQKLEQLKERYFNETGNQYKSNLLAFVLWLSEKINILENEKVNLSIDNACNAVNDGTIIDINQIISHS